MPNLRFYLPILVGLAIFFVVAVAVFRRKKKHPKRPLVSAKEQATYEEFHCIKSVMKQVSEDIYVAQLVFTNRIDVPLNAQSKVPRQISED